MFLIGERKNASLRPSAHGPCNLVSAEITNKDGRRAQNGQDHTIIYLGLDASSIQSADPTPQVTR